MLVVSGVSDAVISIEGDITAEFNVDPEGKNLIAFANGVLLQATLGERWTIEPLCGRTLVGVDPAEECNSTTFSDVATIIGGCLWVACGNQWARFQS